MSFIIFVIISISNQFQSFPCFS